MHHVCNIIPSRPSHALSKNAICTTKLTPCDEGTITREGNTWRRDITQERKEGQQGHKMGQVYAPHPCHNPSCNPCMHCRQTYCATVLTSWDGGSITREESTWRETLPKREKKVSKCTRWGRSVHHTHATTHHATLACIADKPIAQPHSLAATNEA